MSKDPFTSSESKISFDIYRYIFTGVCLSTGGGVSGLGGWCLVPGGGAWSRGGCLIPGGLAQGVPTLGGVSAPGGGCLLQGGGLYPSMHSVNSPQGLEDPRKWGARDHPRQIYFIFMELSEKLCQIIFVGFCPSGLGPWWIQHFTEGHKLPGGAPTYYCAKILPKTA